MAKLTLILVRHGHVEGIQPEKFRGRIDLPLTDCGIAQAKVTAKYLQDAHPATAIYASPLSRCIDTANIIGKPQKLIATPLPDLIDIDYGSWQGHDREDVAHNEPDRFHDWMTRPHLTVIPGGEMLQEVQARLIRALQILRERHSTETIIAVGHDSSNRILLLSALDVPLSKYWTIKQAPCCINVLEFQETGFASGRGVILQRNGDANVGDFSDSDFTVNKINETAHLDRHEVKC